MLTVNWFSSLDSEELMEEEKNKQDWIIELLNNSIIKFSESDVSSSIVVTLVVQEKIYSKQDWRNRRVNSENHLMKKCFECLSSLNKISDVTL